MNTKRVNSAAGVILAALQQSRTPAGIALALESAGLLMTPETANDMASVSQDAVRVAEQSVTELRREHAENARLRERIAELEDEAATAGRAVVRAHRERDLMRERVSEPYGCAHCGEAQGSHGRQYIATVGMHSWERPSDDQVKSRMLARRAARLPMSATSELEQGPALPWAHAMSDGDLHLFLDDLVGAAMNRWRTEPDGTSVPDRETLALVEEACARWRTPGEGSRLDGSGLDGIVRLIAPTQALRAAEDIVHPCGCPKRFDRHAWGCPTLPEPGACCDLHKVPVCCDPEDCGPCCEQCPTCPTLARQRTSETQKPRGGLTADEFNDRYPVGTPVIAYPDTREDPPLLTCTRSRAWELGHGLPVVMVDGYSGGICLTHVDSDPNRSPL